MGKQLDPKADPILKFQHYVKISLLIFFRNIFLFVLFGKKKKRNVNATLCIRVPNMFSWVCDT